jgi:membrane-bound lytic murein transglycosylase D
MYCVEYVIQKGDTLYSISRHYGISVSSLMAANPMVNVYNLRAGEILCIPVSMPSNQYTNHTTYQVQNGDTLGSVLKQYGIGLADLMQQNNLDGIYLMPGMTLTVPVTEEVETPVQE